MTTLPDPQVILDRVAQKQEFDRRCRLASMRIEKTLISIAQEGFPPFHIPFLEKDFPPDLRIALVEQVLATHNKKFTTGEYYISDGTPDAVLVDVRAL